ncbi:MAG: DUF1499 domain-containing protein [Hyphomonas sp.]
MTDFLDFQTLQRPASPNTALIAPMGATPQASPDAPAPEFACAPQETFARLVQLAEARRDWTELAADPAGLRLRFVAVTRLLRFKDDVDIVVLPVAGKPDQSTLAAYSRSRLGYSDLGTNLKRLKALCADLALP